MKWTSWLCLSWVFVAASAAAQENPSELDADGGVPEASFVQPVEAPAAPPSAAVALPAGRAGSSTAALAPQTSSASPAELNPEPLSFRAVAVAPMPGGGTQLVQVPRN